MSCTSCSTNKTPGGCKSNGSCGTGGCGKLNVFDWLANMESPAGLKPFNLVEIRFKNGRKDFFGNDTGVELFQGDIVATEASPGHDIGVVSLSGELVRMQMKKKNVPTDHPEIKKVYRKAKQADIDKWQTAKDLEEPTMYKARTLALKLKLQMKISDVEYQGDKTKAIFYYTADERVDFRELIKIMADEFKVRVEMKQIGARQESSRLGGIGSCGRELCCSTWLTDFRSVSTSAARYQQLSLNPLKLAGQCGKLKCCLNYELDSYLDALKEFPEMEGKKLQTKKGEAFLQKTDIFKRTMWFSYRSDPGVFIPLDLKTVHSILELNAKGEMPEALTPSIKVIDKIINTEPNFENVVGQDSLTRFDRKGKSNQNFKSNRGKPSRTNTIQNKSGKSPVQASKGQQNNFNSKRQINNSNSTEKNKDRSSHTNAKPNLPKNDKKTDSPE